MNQQAIALANAERVQTIDDLLAGYLAHG
jgi:hypothetical protein